MPYTVPTVEEFKARLPKFATVDDATVGTAIIEASTRVSTSWMEGDYQPAIIYLAAHNLTLDGWGTGAEAEVANQGMMGFQSISSGSLSLTRGSGADASAGSYMSTSYGARYAQILRRNSPGFLAV